MNYIVSQFAHPRGLVGRLVGYLMTYENRERNAWAVSLLNVHKNDRVLEIGFGPGWAIQQMATLATAGFVAGVDHSEAMVQVATERNAAAVRAGGKRPFPEFNTDPGGLRCRRHEGLKQQIQCEKH
jgi:SAM-dependent methyltransferase